MALLFVHVCLRTDVSTHINIAAAAVAKVTSQEGVAGSRITFLDGSHIDVVEERAAVLTLLTA